MGSQVRIRLFHILHFVTDFLFPLLKNSKSGVNDRGHRLRSGSPVTNLPDAPSAGHQSFIQANLYLTHCNIIFNEKGYNNKPIINL